MKLIFFLIPFLMLVSFTVTDTDIVGLWESKTPKGNTLGMRFRKGSTYESYLNHKAFVGGPYTLRNDTLIVEDAVCKNATGGKIKGIYRVIFFASDSIRIEIINDSCTARSEGAEYLRFGKVVKN